MFLMSEAISQSALSMVRAESVVVDLFLPLLLILSVVNPGSLKYRE